MGSKICKDKDIVSIINRQLFSNTAAGSCLGFISSQKTAIVLFQSSCFTIGKGYCDNASDGDSDPEILY
jgi:hypothetical protein